MHTRETEFFSGTEAPKPKDISRRIEKVRKHLTLGSSICDIGSGFGEMVLALSKSFSTSGVEPEVKAREFSLSNGLTVYESVDKAKTMGLTFGALTIFHVIEHITNPHKFLQDLKPILKPDGLVFIETPNANDALLTKYALRSFQSFTYWSHHPILYTKKSLCDLLILNGFTILENSGAQRYKLGNHLYWLSYGKPGGHLQWQDFEESLASDAYGEHLIKGEINDTLFIVASLG
jgi:SAM-dependent methyltransferase